MNKFILIALLFLASCAKNNNQLKVAASAIPHAEMLEFIKPQLSAQGIELEIVVTDDYNLPNRALADSEVDANFFQHAPFLERQVEHFGYPIQSAATIEIEPMGLYSKKVHSLNDLPLGATVAIPNDPSNGSRAHLLLQSRPDLKFLEVDAAMLPRTLADVDAAVINTNYALQAQFNPLQDALLLEGHDSPYANILAIRKGEENNPRIQALITALTSEETRAFILKKYQGSVQPAF